MSKNKEQKERKSWTLLVCVGCGGVFYHGLSRMATWCHRRGGVKVLLIDPDKIEERNAARQWGTGIGAYKVVIATVVLYDLGVTNTSYYTTKIISSADLLTMVGKNTGDCNRILVINGPDNHKGRIDIHEGCRLLAGKTGVEVMEITSGNTLERGYAYGCVHVPVRSLPMTPNVKDSAEGPVQIAPGIVKIGKEIYETKTICIGGWMKTHPDIAEEAKKERAGEAQAESCGALKSPVGGHQSITGNMLTALCEWDLAEKMMGGVVGEILWANIPTPNGNAGQRYTKIWANLKNRK